MSSRLSSRWAVAWFSSVKREPIEGASTCHQLQAGRLFFQEEHVYQTSLTTPHVMMPSLVYQPFVTEEVDTEGPPGWSGSPPRGPHVCTPWWINQSVYLFLCWTPQLLHRFIIMNIATVNISVHVSSQTHLHFLYCIIKHDNRSA